GDPTVTSRDRTFTNVPIPAEITELTIEYGSGVDSVDCHLENEMGSTIGWSDGPVLAERDVLDVGTGAVEPGGTYRLTCRGPSGVEEGCLGASQPPAALATVTAVDSPYLSVIAEHYTFPNVSFAA